MRTLDALKPLFTLWTGLALKALGTLHALQTLGTLRSGLSRVAFVAFGALGACVTLLSLQRSKLFFREISVGEGVALVSFFTFFAGGAPRACGSLDSLGSLDALRSLLTLGALQLAKAPPFQVGFRPDVDFLVCLHHVGTVRAGWIGSLQSGERSKNVGDLKASSVRALRSGWADGPLYALGTLRTSLALRAGGSGGPSCSGITFFPLRACCTRVSFDALDSLRAGGTCVTLRTPGSSGAGVSLFALGALDARYTLDTLGPCGSALTLHALDSLLTLGTCCAGVTLFALFSWRSWISLVALVALLALDTLRALHAGRALDSLRAGRATWALRTSQTSGARLTLGTRLALRPGRAGVSLIALVAFRALVSLYALGTLRTGGTLRSSVTFHALGALGTSHIDRSGDRAGLSGLEAHHAGVLVHRRNDGVAHGTLWAGGACLTLVALFSCIAFIAFHAADNGICAVIRNGSVSDEFKTTTLYDRIAVFVVDDVTACRSLYPVDTVFGHLNVVILPETDVLDVLCTVLHSRKNAEILEFGNQRVYLIPNLIRQLLKIGPNLSL